MVTHVKKRDGSIILFNKERIAEAIFSAMKATGIGRKDKAQELAQKVARMVEEKNPYQIPSVEEIQDSIEEVLIKDNDHAAAKSFIIYRENRRRERESKKVLLDVEGTMKEYLDQIDWRVNENSNVGFSLGGLILYISG